MSNELLDEESVNIKFNLDSAKLASYVTSAYYALADLHRVDGNTHAVQQSFRAKLLECMKTEDAAFIYQYDVVCDDTNNPPAVVDTGEVQVDIYWVASEQPGRVYRLLMGPNSSKYA